MRPQRGHGRGRLLAARLLLVLGGAAFILAALELTTRWLAVTRPSLMVPQAGNCLIRHPTRSKALAPNCIGVLYATPLQTNSLGLRGPELRNDGSRRILVLGDSCTMGWRVRQDETYPAVLERTLNDRPDGPRVQVLNAGVAGYTSHQGLTYLRESGLALAPDIVVIAFGWNDVMRLGDVAEQIANENRLLPLIRLDDWLLANSHFYAWSRAAVNRSRQSDDTLPCRVPLERTRQNLNAMAALATEQGARVVFVSFIGSGKAAGHSLAIEGAAADQGAPLIAYDGPRLDVVHPTAAGYRRLAEQIAAAIEEHGWLDDGAGRE